MDILIAVLCTFGNSLVLISVGKFEWLHSPTNYFVALLAMFDLLQGIPLSIGNRALDTIFSGGKLYNDK